MRSGGLQRFCLDNIRIAFILNKVYIEIPMTHNAARDLESELCHFVEKPLDLHVHLRSHDESSVVLGPAKSDSKRVSETSHPLLLPKLLYIINQEVRGQFHVQVVFTLNTTCILWKNQINKNKQYNFDSSIPVNRNWHFWPLSMRKNCVRKAGIMMIQNDSSPILLRKIKNNILT